MGGRRRRIEGGRVVATEPPALPPEAQAAADRALLREAMLGCQLEPWIAQRAIAPQGLSPEIAALQRLRARGPIMPAAHTASRKRRAGDPEIGLFMTATPFMAQRDGLGRWLASGQSAVLVVVLM